MGALAVTLTTDVPVTMTLSDVVGTTLCCHVAASLNKPDDVVTCGGLHLFGCTSHRGTKLRSFSSSVVNDGQHATLGLLKVELTRSLLHVGGAPKSHRYKRHDSPDTHPSSSSMTGW